MNSIRLINGIRREFTPVDAFRTAHALPEAFSAGSLLQIGPTPQPAWDASTLLAELQARLVHAIPATVSEARLPEVPDAIAAVFRSELTALSTTLALSMEEIDTAVLDLHDLLMPAVYRLVDLTHRYPGQPEAVSREFDMADVIQNFLNESTFVGTQTYTGATAGAPAGWSIQVVYDHFGPFGLLVTTGEETACVLDRTGSSPSAVLLPQLALTLGEAMGRRYIQTS